MPVPMSHYYGELGPALSIFVELRRLVLARVKHFPREYYRVVHNTSCRQKRSSTIAKRAYPQQLGGFSG